MLSNNIQQTIKQRQKPSCISPFLVLKQESYSWKSLALSIILIAIFCMISTMRIDVSLSGFVQLMYATISLGWGSCMTANHACGKIMRVSTEYNSPGFVHTGSLDPYKSSYPLAYWHGSHAWRITVRTKEQFVVCCEDRQQRQVGKCADT